MAKIKTKQIEDFTSAVNSLISSAVTDLHIEKIGYQGVLPASATVQAGMEYVLGTDLTGSSLIASTGDYLVAKEDFTYSSLPSSASDIDTFLAHFVIVEQNIKNVSNGTAESGKYVSGVTMANGVITISKETVPVQGVAAATAGSGKTTTAVTGISLSGNKIVPTTQSIDLHAYPQAVETLTVSNGSATLSHTPNGNVQVCLNGVAQTLGTDYTVSGTTVTVLSAMGYDSESDVLTAIYNYEN